MRKTHVMLHHSLTQDSGTLSWGAIRKYHIEVNGWRDCGYHLGCELVNDHYEVILGRALDEDGAHCYQDEMNKKSLGFCFVGDFDKAPPPTIMLECAARHLRSIMKDLGIVADVDHVRMHRQHAGYKTCPGTEFPFKMFLDMLTAAI